MFKLPTKTEFYFSIFLSVAVGLLFTIVYGAAAKIGAGASEPLHMYMNWELAIPFIPSFIFIYFSLNLLTAAPLFFLDLKGLKAFGVALALSIVIAGLCFAVFPGTLGYTRVVPETYLKPLYELLFQYDNLHNVAPSLHITLSAITVLFLNHTKYAIAFYIWFGLIVVSVLFTHQHHVIDILSGIVLAYGCTKTSKRLIN